MQNKTFDLRLKLPLLDFLGRIFKKNVVITEISRLKFVKSQSLI